MNFFKRGIGWNFSSRQNPNHLRIYVPAGVPIVLEGSIESLGNASPASVEVSQKIGETLLDLDGPWGRDAGIEVRIGIGECRLSLPSRDVGVEIERAHVTLGESDLSVLQDRPPVEEGMPTLRVSMSGRLGEISVGR